MNNFGARIKQLRIEYGLTQKEVSNGIGITPTSVQRLEYETANPSLDTLIKLSLFFNVSLDYLAGLSTRRSLSDDGNNLSKKQLRLLQHISNLKEADIDLLFSFIKRLEE